MASRLAISLCGLVVVAGSTARLGATTYTPPPGPLASPAAIKAVLATIPPPAAGETVVDFEKAEIGEPVAKWEERGVVFELAGPLKRTPAAKPRVMFFPHLGTDHKGILNAMSTDQSVPLKMSFPGTGATSVTLVLWGSTGCPARERKLCTRIRTDGARPLRGSAAFSVADSANLKTCHFLGCDV